MIPTCHETIRSIVAALFLTVVVAAEAEDWPRLLGPTDNMVSGETNLVKAFPAGGPRLVWAVEKGDGYAAPAVLGERLVMFHRVGDEAVVDCLNANDGQRLWRFAYPTKYRDRYGYNHGPRCGPVIAGEAVFTLGADGQLHCLELATGKVRWCRDVAKEFGLKQNFFGVGSTPLVEGDKLIVNVGATGGPCVVAFDVKSGKTVWGAGKDWGPSYAAPVAATIGGQRRVFVFAGGESDPPTGGLLEIDPADGKVVSQFPWRGRRYESVNASAPVVIGNRVFVSECYGAGSALVEEGKAVWTNAKAGVHFMTPVVKDGFVYGVAGHGPGDAWLVCLNGKTGELVWRERPTWTDSEPGLGRCWLMLVDGRCLCLGEYGHLLWLDLNPQGYRELARTRLFAARETWTPPVLSRGLLYVCQNSRNATAGTSPRLLCYELCKTR